MGIATHLGPWLLGTNRYTTGTAAADTRNTGATQVVQTDVVNFNDADNANAFVLPAGSLITNFRFITTTTLMRLPQSLCRLVEQLSLVR